MNSLCFGLVALVVFTVSGVRTDRCDVVYITRARTGSVNGRYYRQRPHNGYDVFKHEAGQKYLYHVGYYWFVGLNPSYQYSLTYLRARDLTKNPEHVRTTWQEKDRYGRWLDNRYIDVDCSVINDDSRWDSREGSFDNSRYDNSRDNSRYDNSRDNSRYDNSRDNSRYDNSRYDNSRDNSRYDNSRDNSRYDNSRDNSRYDDSRD